ncbi:uncharacterized protein LOC119959009 [Scyliorhinus canicula]|uniref:uncharacterized protein LOC119959009 n=1 Tax=Scyliorhinus canicula TaxID=7830 RepID=UPI0018F608FA|nr:uncharacterized protein LOC119959009 [Scyliorhinus canicula]
MLRDRLVCGINNVATQRKLLTEPTLTFQQAIQIVFSRESAERGVQELQGMEVHAFGCNTSVQKHLPAPLRYLVRGRLRINASGCQTFLPEGSLLQNQWMRSHRSVGLVGADHISDRNWGQLRDRTFHLDESAVTTPEDVETEDDCLQLHCVAAPSVAPIKVTVPVNGHALEMELDTGAAVSVIAQRTFDRIKQGIQTLKLTDTKASLATDMGEPLDIAGTMMSPFVNRCQEGHFPLIVVPACRDWLLHLWLHFKHILQTASEVLTEVLGQYPDVFQPGLGK